MTNPLALARRTRLAQAIGFFAGDGLAEFGDAVIAPPLVVELRRRALVHLDDQVVVEHALNGSIERAGAEPDFAVRPRQDFLDDGVAVAVFVGQRHQDVKDRRLSGSDRHGSHYIHCGYNFNGYKTRRPREKVYFWTTTVPAFMTQRTPLKRAATVGRRIAINGDEVRQIAGRDSAEAIAHSEQLAGVVVAVASACVGVIPALTNHSELARVLAEHRVDRVRSHAELHAELHRALHRLLDCARCSP